MQHTLDQFTDNPIIDEIVCWPPRKQAIRSIRASVPIFRKPFIEVTLTNGETLIRSFVKSGFGSYWAEARIILDTLTAIKLVTDFKLAEYPTSAELVQQVLAEREESIAEAGLMFDHGMYQQYLAQFGHDYKDLPHDVLAKIELAHNNT